jgi:hypothetical protein
MLAFGLRADGEAWSRASVAWVWTGLAMGGLVAVVALSFNTRRFYVYGALIFLAGVVHQWGGVPLWLAVTLVGGAIVVSGTMVLRRFLRENPKVDEAANA